MPPPTALRTPLIAFHLEDFAWLYSVYLTQKTQLFDRKKQVYFVKILISLQIHVVYLRQNIKMIHTKIRPSMGPSTFFFLLDKCEFYINHTAEETCWGQQLEFKDHARLLSLNSFLKETGL